MTLTLTLPPEVEVPLRAAAERRHMSIEAYVLQLLEGEAARSAEEERKLAILQALIDDHERAALENGEDTFFEDMDASRPVGRKLYPLQLKGVTW